MKVKIVFSALFVLLLVGMSNDANAQRRRRWASDDRKIDVPKPEESHLVYDGDRVIANRDYHDSRPNWYRHYDATDYRENRRRDHDRYDRYYKRNHTKYHYTRDYTKD